MVQIVLVMCNRHESGALGPCRVQVIEDSIAVVAHVRKERAVPRSAPNIVVGGSYGKGKCSPALTHAV